MLEKRNRKALECTVEYLEKEFLDLEGTEHLTYVEFNPARNIVTFYTTRLCITEDIEVIPEGQEAKHDFHYYDCGDVGGGWPHPASAHRSFKSTPDPYKKCECTIPNKRSHVKCCTCVQDESTQWKNCPTHGYENLEQIPQPVEPIDDKQVSRVVFKRRKQITYYTDGSKKTKRNE